MAPDFERPLEILRQFDVGEQLDVLAVERRRRHRDEALQLLLLERELALLEPVLGEDRAVRIDDDDVARAVDDQELVLLNERARVVRGDDRGHVQAARDDRGMRSHAAEIGQERGEVVILELDDVGRREVVRDEDRLLLGVGRPHRARLAHQHFQHAFHDLHDIGLALAQVRIFDRVELLDQHGGLLRQRPFGIAALLGDDSLRRFRERRIGEDHPVDVEKRAELGRRVLRGHFRAQALEFLLHEAHRLRQACDLGRDLIGGDGVVRGLERRVRDELRPPDGDAAGDADSVEDEAHGATLLTGAAADARGRLAQPSSPKRSLMSSHHRGHRRSFVRTGGLEADGGAHARGEHHHREDIARVGAPTVEDKRYAASKA